MECKTPWYRSVIALILLILPLFAVDERLPYAIKNNSTYTDDQVWVALVGITDGHVWLDGKTNAVRPMNKADNTLAGPVIGGNSGPGLDGKYANCFTKLSDIPGKTLQVPKIAGCRILISFGSPLYLYFFGHSGAPSGYAAPNLANPTDPNQGIRFEMIELTWNQYGLWTNTTRVDSYQYAMNLRVTGANGFDKSVGELISHDSLISRWKKTVPAPFDICLDEKTGTIHAPSKLAAFQEGGKHADYFKPYVDSIWETFKTKDLIFSSGDAGIWKGRVIGEQFVFKNQTNLFGNATAYITRRPNTQEVLEGKGVLAENVQNLSTQTLDLVVQAQFCAALNRHAVNCAAPEGMVQDWSDESAYFATGIYNGYVKFWHERDLSVDGKSYGFCYDDVFDKSSTIHTPSPNAVTITLGTVKKDSTPMKTTTSAKQTALSIKRIGTELMFNRPVAAGTLLQINSLRGQILFQGYVSGSTAAIPEDIGSGVIVWHISERGERLSGLVRL